MDKTPTARPKAALTRAHSKACGISLARPEHEASWTAEHQFRIGIKRQSGCPVPLSQSD
jgi:hypothetical protein